MTPEDIVRAEVPHVVKLLEGHWDVSVVDGETVDNFVRDALTAGFDRIAAEVQPDFYLCAAGAVLEYGARAIPKNYGNFKEAHPAEEHLPRDSSLPFEGTPLHNSIGAHSFALEQQLTLPGVAFEEYHNDQAPIVTLVLALYQHGANLGQHHQDAQRRSVVSR